jgi:hypothetical protein
MAEGYYVYIIEVNTSIAKNKKFIEKNRFTLTGSAYF